MFLVDFRKSLCKYSSKEKSESSAWFFKTGKGEYGESDIFLGITVPNVRRVVKEYLQPKVNQPLAEIINDAVELLQSKYHEERLASVILLTSLYKVEYDKNKKIIFKTYLKNTNRINNWDLVDSSAPHIIGGYLLSRQDLDRNILYKLAKSKNLWERRIAIVSTFMFIKNKEYEDTFKLCEILMKDKEDLIHKACGWMLREVGKNCGQNILNNFLDKNVLKMPRTMLRYSLEKHNEKDRKKYLNLK